jgi:hypothetical protein
LVSADFHSAFSVWCAAILRAIRRTARDAFLHDSPHMIASDPRGLWNTRVQFSQIVRLPAMNVMRLAWSAVDPHVTRAGL